MIRRTSRTTDWLEFEQLQEFPDLVHGVFLRPIDTGPEVCVDYSDTINQLFSPLKLISPKQVHGSCIREVLKSSCSLGPCDGLVTNETRRALITKHADCQAALFFDPKEKLLASVHCGWRGNVLNIYKEMIGFLKSKGSKPQNILVCISPSLGPMHSEFIHYETEFPEELWSFQWKENYFDLWEMSKAQLKEAGILSSHIECAGLCTYENYAEFFSYRRDKAAGRNVTAAMLV